MYGWSDSFSEGKAIVTLPWLTMIVGRCVALCRGQIDVFHAHVSRAPRTGFCGGQVFVSSSKVRHVLDKHCI